MNERFPIPQQSSAMETPVPVREAVHNRSENGQDRLLSNRRIQQLIQARDEAERDLQEAISDMETREADPAFQMAQLLYNRGIRVESEIYDENACIYHITDDTGKKHRLTSPGYNFSGPRDPRAVEESGVFELLGIFDEENRYSVLTHLENLCVE